MVAGSDTSKCGTVQGPLRVAQAEKTRLIADIAEAILPLVASVVVPKVEKGLLECPELQEGDVLEAFWKDVNGIELDAVDRKSLELTKLSRTLDPEERREIAADVARKEARKLVGVWLRKLVALTMSGYLPAVQAIGGGSLMAGFRIGYAECRRFEVLRADEASRILKRIADLPQADAIFSMVNVYLVL